MNEPVETTEEKKELFQSPFGYERPWQDRRQMCKYCFNEDTQRVTDAIELEPYERHHAGREFRVYDCFCCRGRWHYAMETEEGKR